MKKISKLILGLLLVATFGFSINETRVIGKEIIARDRLISYGTAELSNITAESCEFSGDVIVNGTLSATTLDYNVVNNLTTDMRISGNIYVTGNAEVKGIVSGNSLQINGNSIITGISTLNNVIASTVNSTVILGTNGTITNVTATNLTPTNINSSGTATLNRAIISSVNITTANIGNIITLGSLTMTGALHVGTTLRVIDEAVYDKSITLNEELKFASLNGTIKTGSADGADNRSLTIAGASASSNRGSYLTVYGNEHANVGSTIVNLGNNAGAYFKVKNGAGAEALRIDGLSNAVNIGTANIAVLNTTVNISNLSTTGSITVTTINATNGVIANVTATTINASGIVSASALQVNGNITTSGKIETTNTSADAIYSKGGVKADGQLITGTKTPASATATGTTGTICWDANYIYVCTATNTWKRVAIATW